MQRETETGSSDPGSCEFLGDHCVEAKVTRATSSVLLGDRHAEESVATGRHVQLARSDAGGFPVEVMRGYLLGHEGPETVGEGEVFGLVEVSFHPTSIAGTPVSGRV